MPRKKTAEPQPVLREDAPRRKTRKAYARAVLAAERQVAAEKKISQSNISAFDGEYTPRLGKLLFELVLDGNGLRQISTLPGMPPCRELTAWAGDPQHPFHTLYYEARRLLVPLLEEAVLITATEPMVGVRTRRHTIIDRLGAERELTEVIESDNVERAKLRVHALLATLGWTFPQKHGAKAQPPAQGGSTQLEALFEALKAGPSATEGDDGGGTADE